MSGIVIDNLTKIYHDKKVLDSISINITEPGIYLIAGPNGSGKTTLFEILAGLRKSSDGSILIAGYPPNSYQAKCQIGFLSQQNCLRKNCYVKEELELICQLYGISDIDLKEYLKQYGLEAYYHYKTKKLSGGLKRRLLLCMTFLPKQKIAVLDEPVSGLDTFSRNEIWNMITESAKDKIVLVSDHYLNQAAQYADYIYLLDAGRIIAKGNVEDLMKSIPMTHVIKARKGKQEKVEQMLSVRGLNFDLKISGTVYNYYFSDENSKIVNELPRGEYVLNPIDFEDVYFYYTGKYSCEGGDSQ